MSRSLKMAKRSLGDLNGDQRRVLQDWAAHMGVGQAQMINLLNKLDDHKPISPWQNLDRMAKTVHDCPDC